MSLHTLNCLLNFVFLTVVYDATAEAELVNDAVQVEIISIDFRLSTIFHAGYLFRWPHIALVEWIAGKTNTSHKTEAR